MESISYVRRHKEDMIRFATYTLVALNVVTGAYIALYPYFPEIQFQAQKVLSAEPEIGPEAVDSFAFIPSNVMGVLAPGDMEEKYLYIPAAGVYESIIEADNIKQVRELIWHRTPEANPETGSNMVLAGHRYVTIGGERASTFYHLPKVSPGDLGYIRWNDLVYVYEFTDSEVVPPTAIEIEAPTENPRLTIYTCTPLWDGSERHVVYAEPVDTINLDIEI